MGEQRKARARQSGEGTAVVDTPMPAEFALPSDDEPLPHATAEMVAQPPSEVLTSLAGLAPNPDSHLLSALLDSLPDNVYFKDAHSRFLRVNRAMARYLGLVDPREAVGRSDSEFFAPEHAAEAMRDEREVMRTGQPLVGKDEREVWADGQVRWVSTTKLPLRDADGRTIGTFGISRDITARKRAEEHLYEQAFYDPLTRLPNRALFLDRLNHVLRRSRRRGDYRFAVLFLDMDRFKGVNDSLGHVVGDQLLVAVARRLEMCVRPGDTVARLGGDEFTILLDGVRGPEDAARVAERILREMQAPFSIGGTELYGTTSIGITLGTGDYAQADEILRDADTAMYDAKNGGRARFSVFQDGMREHARTILQLETDLRRALDRNELELYYQPIVCIDTGRVVGMESLLRWNHPERGLVGPVEFIGLAEETGLICPIGLWSIREACTQMRTWQALYPTIPPLRMSANISPRQFAEPDVLGSLQRILTETAIDPRTLNLEITESALVENVDGGQNILTRLRALGVRIHIDDFGMGYSSLGQLERFPIDGIKIDRSFVARLGTQPKTLEIVRAIVQLAVNLGLEVTAEGVETEEQLARVSTLGCRRVQGFLYARPLPASAMEKLLATQPWARSPAA